MTNIRPISFNPTTAKRFEDREEMYVGMKIRKTSKSAYFIQQENACTLL